MSYASALLTFATQAARERQLIWPVSVTPTGIAAVYAGLKTPTQISRIQQEQGGGWVQRAIATFHFRASDAYRPDIGAEFEVVATSTAEELNTHWRCFDLTRADDSVGADHRCVCFRLD